MRTSRTTYIRMAECENEKLEFIARRRETAEERGSRNSGDGREIIDRLTDNQIE